jgi:hypothetical protein
MIVYNLSLLNSEFILYISIINLKVKGSYAKILNLSDLENYWISSAPRLLLQSYELSFLIVSSNGIYYI